MTKQESDNTKIALINNNIGFIQKDVSEIKNSVKELAGVYATREALVEVAKQTEDRFRTIESAITELAKSNGFWKWFAPTLTGLICAILSSILTFLIIQYLTNSR